MKLEVREPRFIMKPGTLGSGSTLGGNSGFQALNLALQLGCRDLILVGFDMHVRNGEHWHGRHPRGLNNPTAETTERWRVALDSQADFLKGLGARVINASPSSALTAYPKMTLTEALQCSSLD